MSELSSDNKIAYDTWTDLSRTENTFSTAFGYFLTSEDVWDIDFPRRPVRGFLTYVINIIHMVLSRKDNLESL